VNGLKTVNGLTTLNGLKTINGLTTINGLKTINGLITINGLTTINGLASINGLSVDCTGKTPGVSCTGIPDGVLSAGTGMMASDEGVATAKYLVRCALSAGDGVRVKDYTGATITLNGELGLAPSWKSGDCDQTCQERLSACLMALTNGAGDHVDVELSAINMPLGGGHSTAFKYQEAAFYGNLFADPPVANYCIGKDFAGLNILGLNVLAADQRACSGYWTLFGDTGCPYKKTGDCNASLLDWNMKCENVGGTMTKCEPPGSNARTFLNPITTYRKSR